MEINKKEWHKFLQFTQYSLFPVPGKEYRNFLEGNNPDFWMRDWTEIEIAKCFLIGDKSYRQDPLPERCILSNSFSIESIISSKNNLVSRVKKITEKNEKDLVIDWDIGRGMPIILARSVKKWDSYICGDEDPRYEKILKTFFPSENIIFKENIR